MKLKFFSKKTKFTRSLLIYIFYSLLLTFIVDSISRNSINATYNFILSSPLTFIYNSFIILVTLSVILLTKRKLFAYYVISLIWIILGIANNIVNKLRGMPLTGSDLKLIKSGLSIAENYISKKQLFLIFTALFILIAFSLLLFILGPKSKLKINYITAIVTICILMLSSKFITSAALRTGVISNNFWNIIVAYNENGFIYSFNNTLLHHGMSKPLVYNRHKVNDILTSLNEDDAVVTLSSPTISNNSTESKNCNVIMIQLEAFFDPTLIKGVKFDIDPISNFRNLTNQYSTGSFSVSTIGGGTANTEFEAITGLNLDFFAAGEYPYNTILNSHTVESMSYILKKEGYATHAIHNHEATFYGRNVVFQNLGFDTFTPVEYMAIKERNPVGWAKDYPLTAAITDCLSSTPNQDFIYTITVQGHGSYPSDVKLKNKKVTITECPDNLNKKQIEYYANQLYETDQFIGQLIDAVSQTNENSIIAFYGDHLPGLGLSAEMLSTNNLYSTEYVIWNNIGLEKKDEDLEAYQITSKILHDLKINSGIATKLHEEYLYPSSDKSMSYDTYQDNLRILQYDMLFGKGYSYENNQPYKPTQIKYGVKPITVKKVYLKGNKIYAEGENFTYNTVFIINNNIYPCKFINEHTICYDSADLKSGDTKIKIGQFIGKLEVIQATDEFILGQDFSGELK